MKRSHKPVVWGLFAGGGTLAAFLVPAMIFTTGLAVPLGLISPEALSYQRVLGIAGNPVAALVLFLVLALLLWHAAHRLRLTAHDFGIHNARLIMFVCYGTAALATIASMLLLIGAVLRQ